MNSLLAITDAFTSVLELVMFGYGLARWEQLDRSRRLLTAWAGGWVMATGVMLLLSRRAGYSHMAMQLFLPLSVLLAMGALAALQRTRRNRDVFRIVGALYAVVWAVVTFTLEDLGDFSIITGPIHHLLITGAAAFTLQGAVRHAQGELLDDPAAVVSIGFILFAAPTALVQPAIPVYEGEPMLAGLLTARNLVAILGYAALIRAIGLPRMNRRRVTVAA
ncbi:MAG: hypothetical protein ABJC19_11730 [Gemmatimonadota bacterium]